MGCGLLLFAACLLGCPGSEKVWTANVPGDGWVQEPGLGTKEALPAAWPAGALGSTPSLSACCCPKGPLRVLDAAGHLVEGHGAHT